MASRKPNLRRKLSSRLATIGLACLGLALAAAPAGATTIYVHPYVKSFDATGSKSSVDETGPFYNVDHIAIDQSTGNVYVLDLARESTRSMSKISTLRRASR